MPIPEELPDIIVDVYGEIAELKRKSEDQSFHGTVAETDFSGSYPKYRILIEGDDPQDPEQAYLSPWLPAAETGAGKNKTFVPLSKGEQVRVGSQTGDLTDGIIEKSLPYDDEPLPSNDEKDTVIMKRGDASVKISDDGNQIVFDVGGTSITITKDGVVITTPDFLFKKK